MADRIDTVTYEIPAGRWRGYLWESDATPDKVVVLTGAYPVAPITLDASRNPFVIEGQLYNAEEGISLSVRYADGRYVIIRYPVRELEREFAARPSDVREALFLPAFRVAPGRLRFRTYWREESDPLCEGFAASRPAEFVFVGFETIKNE